jgi:hypothetical protein
LTHSLQSWKSDFFNNSWFKPIKKVTTRMSVPFFAAGSASESSDDGNDPAAPLTSGINLASSSDDDSSRAAIPGASTFSFSEVAQPSRIQRTVHRTPLPAVVIEPALSESEVAALTSFPLPDDFTIPLVTSPDVALLGQGLLQQYGIVELLQQLS